jgi:hypothetical protein
MIRARIGDRLTVLLLGVAVGLATLLALELHAPAPELGATLSRPSESGPQSDELPVYTPPPLSRYDGVLERPLFEKGRTVPEEPAEATEAAEPAKPPPEIKVRLEGVAITPGESVALLRRTAGPTGASGGPGAAGSDLVRVRRGETLDGWRLAEVRPDGVVLRLGERTVELALELPERQAGGASKGKPRAPVPRKPPFVLKNAPDRGPAAIPEPASPPAAAAPESGKDPASASHDRGKPHP